MDETGGVGFFFGGPFAPTEEDGSFGFGFVDVFGGGGVGGVRGVRWRWRRGGGWQGWLWRGRRGDGTRGDGGYGPFGRGDGGGLMCF